MRVSPLKRPSAYTPLLISAAGLCVVIGHAAIYGVAHEADEGAAAHIFQILMVAQVPFIIYFGVKWLPREPWPALRVMALQCGVIAAALASVYFLT
jgi:hypothetical protein